MANQINLDLLWADLGGKTDPTDTKWEGGWVAEIPTYQNFNYVLHAMESNLLHLAENGAFQWQTEINYEKGTFVRDGGFEWFCITANSGNKPSNDATNSYWTNGKIVGRTPVTPYTQKHGLYVANVNDRTLTTWSGNDVTLENDTTLVAFNTTSTATDNLIFGNVGGELVVVDVGNAVVPDGRTLSLSNNKVHRLYHEGHPPKQTEVEGTVPEAPNDGRLYARKGSNWVKSSSTDVQTQPPPPNTGAGGGWYNLDDGQLYLDVNDGDSSQWVPASPPIIPSKGNPNALVRGTAPYEGRTNYQNDIEFVAHSENKEVASRQARYARSVAVNPPVMQETMRLDYANRAYGLGDKSVGIIDDIQAFETAQTLTRSSTKWATGANGQLVEYASNEPSYLYDNDGQAQGILIESQSTNLITNSEEFNSLWNKVNVEIDADLTIAPDGSLTAQKLYSSTVNGEHFIEKQITTPDNGTKMFASVFVKAASGNGQVEMRVASASAVTTHVDLTTGTVLNGEGTIEKLTNGWFKVVTPFEIANSSAVLLYRIQLRNGSNNRTFTGDGAEGVYAWGAQLEENDFATSYIPTLTSQVTRALDTIDRSIGSELNLDGFTLSGEVKTKPVERATTIVSLRTSDNINNIVFGLPTFGESAIRLGNGAQISLSDYSTVYTAGEAVKFSLSFDRLNLSLAINGLCLTVGVSSLEVEDFYKVFLGSFGEGGSGTIDGSIKNLRLSPHASTQAQLEAMTV
jgi:hypothetical protein